MGPQLFKPWTHLIPAILGTFSASSALSNIRGATFSYVSAIFYASGTSGICMDGGDNSADNRSIRHSSLDNNIGADIDSAGLYRCRSRRARHIRLRPLRLSAEQKSSRQEQARLQKRKV